MEIEILEIDSFITLDFAISSFLTKECAVKSHLNKIGLNLDSPITKEMGIESILDLERE